MIIFNDGYSMNGTVDNSIININNEWAKVLIIKTSLPVEEAEALFVDKDTFTYGNTVYISGGYIKTLQEDSMTYTWLKFKYSYVKENQTELIDKLITDNINMQLQLDTMIATNL